MESEAGDEKVVASQRLASALTHPQRVRILAELNKRTIGPQELSRASGAGLPRVTYHFKVLEKLGGLGVADRSSLHPGEDPKTD